ncbi:MAG: heparinase II/III family protein [Anaerolineae bacterium]|nr:heparinase II/III family protein [Anaerolineae bacterium]
MTMDLEPLRDYTTSAPDSLPPEIIPWERRAPWNLDHTARVTLGLLLDGDRDSDLLLAAADYLLVFNKEGYTQDVYPDALLLNGTALALCGYLCDHPEADLWRVTGSARLATAAHERRAALSDTLLARCLLAVCQVADELDAPILADLVTLRERMWGRLLDHSRAERLSVAEAEYPQHMADPIPVEQVGELMRSRVWQQGLRSVNFMGGDQEEADNACNNLITLRAHMLVRHQFGSEIDWTLRLFDDKESTVSLGAQSFIRNLANVYADTGDEQYAVHAARLLWSFYRLNPLPNHHQYLGPWRTLEVGNRQCNMWPGIVGLMGQSESFDAATHAMMARSRLEHLRYALAYCGWTNNWYQVEASGMAVAALYSPELTHADAYLRIALRRLKWINSFAYYDDGFQFELTHGYHVFPTVSIFAVVQAAQARGVELPADFVGLVERAHEMYLFAQQPDHFLPTFNDCNPNPMDPAPLLQAAADAFERDDFRWGATHGAAGQAPDHTSHAWNSAGLYVMRDRWDEDAQYLHFDGAAWGASHQHEDKLNFMLHAGGRLLIGDPNIYSYAWTEQTHYFKSSRAHNVVLIDGIGQARRFNPEARLMTQGRNEWVSQDGFDFVSSEYLEGFAPDPFQSDDRAQWHSGGPVDTRFQHRRAIFYLKPGYWILCDLLRGDDTEPHTLEQLFHIAPIFDLPAAVPLRAGVVDVTPQGIVTRDPGLSNLAILPVDSDGLSARAQKGETNPARGWYGVMGEFPAWDVTLETQTALPARLDAVLYPLDPGSETYPAVTRLRADAQVTAFRISGAGIDDTFILCEEESGPVTVDDITFEGRALLLRHQPTLRALAVNPVTVQVDGVEVTPE